ncbi:MAG: hypothetical protein QOD83_1144 [Solirubrobacteraceae bacterium]|nr:hypothetical protein [Solirubrobacteraceae bacterium]
MPPTRLLALAAIIAGLLSSPAAAPRVTLTAGGDRAPWVALLDGFVHGPELSTVTLMIATPAEAQARCAGAESCYEPATGTIVAADRAPRGYTIQEMVAHEYGHHIAAAQRNDPWDSYDWGTKRWASYEDVCVGVAAGRFFPGDQGARYAQNPGEAFADAYRILNGGKGASPFDARLAPDSTSLQLLREDIEHPWRGPQTLVRRGLAPARVRIGTQLDGTFTAAAAGRRLKVVDAATGRVLARGRGRVRARICGQDALTVVVSGRGRFRLRMQRP